MKNEALAKFVCWNICAVVQAMFEMGANPVFWVDQAQAGNVKFTIRDLLWLTVVVAVGAGWWVDHYHTSERAQLEWRNEILQTALERDGWTVEQSGWKALAIKKDGSRSFGGDAKGRNGGPETYSWTEKPK